MTSSYGSALHGLVRDAERAGAAMGCRYSSAAEYEAALIAERRRAGAYGRTRWQKAPIWVVGAVAAMIALIAFALIR